MKEKILNGKRFRYHYKTHVWVCEDGTRVVDEFNYDLEIVSNIFGLMNVRFKHGLDCLLSEIVADCFCKPHPDDGKDYFIFYKDLDGSNCSYQNLVWKSVPYWHTSDPETNIIVNGEKFWVSKEGKISINGKTLNVCDYECDSSGVRRWVEPRVYYSGGYLEMDWLMKEAGYIQGDNSPLTNPVILHRDNDVMNFHSDNLEWVEERGVAYTFYQAHKSAWIRKRERDLNP